MGIGLTDDVLRVVFFRLVHCGGWFDDSNLVGAAWKDLADGTGGEGYLHGKWQCVVFH